MVIYTTDRYESHESGKDRVDQLRMFLSAKQARNYVREQAELEAQDMSRPSTLIFVVREWRWTKMYHDFSDTKVVYEIRVCSLNHNEIEVLTDTVYQI